MTDGYLLFPKGPPFFPTSFDVGSLVKGVEDFHPGRDVTPHVDGFSPIYLERPSEVYLEKT